jgi:hypothetical protein
VPIEIEDLQTVGLAAEKKKTLVSFKRSFVFCPEPGLANLSVPSATWRQKSVFFLRVPVADDQMLKIRVEDDAVWGVELAQSCARPTPRFHMAPIAP